MDKNFIGQVVYRLSTNDTYQEGPDGYRLTCPNPNCGSGAFLLSKSDGSGLCLDEPWLEGGYRRYSRAEIAGFLRLQVDLPVERTGQEVPAKLGLLRTGRVSRFLGISDRQLRRHEQQGRIPTAKRDHLGRYYTVVDLAALEKILQTYRLSTGR